MLRDFLNIRERGTETNGPVKPRWVKKGKWFEPVEHVNTLLVENDDWFDPAILCKLKYEGWLGPPKATSNCEWTLIIDC